MWSNRKVISVRNKTLFLFKLVDFLMYFIGVGSSTVAEEMFILKRDTS